jgi:hypothetical protein
LKRDYAKWRPGHKNWPSESRTGPAGTSREIQRSLDHDELLGLLQDSLQALALELGLLVASAILDEEPTSARRDPGLGFVRRTALCPDRPRSATAPARPRPSGRTCLIQEAHNLHFGFVRRIEVRSPTPDWVHPVCEFFGS